MDEMNQMPESETVDNPAEEMPEDAGRGTDNVMAHMSLGEIVIPRAFQDDPDFMQMLQMFFEQNGVDINEFTVGHEANKINPETGYPEFFLGKFGKFLGKVGKYAAPLALSFLAPGIGTAIGGGLLGAGAAGSATLGNALLGAGIGGLTGGGKGALIGGTLGGLGANLGKFGSAAQGPGTAASAGAPIGSGSGILGALGNAAPGIANAANSFSSALPSASSIFGSSAGTPLSTGAQGATQGTGIAGAITRNLPSLSEAAGGSTGGSSTFSGIGSRLASGLSGVQEQDAIKRLREQQLAANSQQLANLESFDPSGIAKDPGYEFQRSQGEQALNRSLGAQGNVFSGRALKAATDYNQNYANTAFKDYYDRWLNKVSGQNALYGSGGDIRANATLAGSNSLSKALSGVLGNQGLTLEDLLKRQQLVGYYG